MSAAEKLTARVEADVELVTSFPDDEYCQYRMGATYLVAVLGAGCAFPRQTPVDAFYAVLACGEP